VNGCTVGSLTKRTETDDASLAETVDTSGAFIVGWKNVFRAIDVEWISRFNVIK